VYFLKQTDGELANAAALERSTEYGVLTGDCLGNLELILKEVYAPLLDFELSAPDAAEGDLHVTDSVRSELKNSMQRFESHISHAHSQVSARPVGHLRRDCEGEADTCARLPSPAGQGGRAPSDG
jgi:hypothetical protein